MAKCGSAGGPVSVKAFMDVLAANSIEPDTKEVARIER